VEEKEGTGGGGVCNSESEVKASRQKLQTGRKLKRRGERRAGEEVGAKGIALGEEEGDATAVLEPHIRLRETPTKKKEGR